MKAAEMKKGLTIVLDGKLYTIIDFEHVKCGKGGAIYQTGTATIINSLLWDHTIDYSYTGVIENRGMMVIVNNTIWNNSDLYGRGLCRIEKSIDFL